MILLQTLKLVLFLKPTKGREMKVELSASDVGVILALLQMEGERNEKFLGSYGVSEETRACFERANEGLQRIAGRLLVAEGLEGRINA